MFERFELFYITWVSFQGHHNFEVFKMYFIKFVGIDDSLHTDHIYFPLIPCEILQEIFQRLKKQKVQACGISIFCFFFFVLYLKDFVYVNWIISAI